mgnify:CR=1 FL=1
MAIVNLQKTPKDKKAALVIHARCDLVMQRLMVGLGLEAEVRLDKGSRMHARSTLIV